MSTGNEVRLELLIGTLVVDVDGIPLGRIEEVRAHRRGSECYIDEYVVGREGLAQRLGLHALGLTHKHEPSVIPWKKLDLSDPAHPRLTCRIADLGS